MRTRHIRIVTFTGRPGSGKSTIIKNVLAVCPDLQMFAGRSVTTRPRRKGDVKGEYLHVKKEKFATLETQGEFLWTAEHNGYDFGTRKADVENALAAEVVSVMTLVPEAVEKLIAYAGQERVMSFFIHATREVLMHRMLVCRGDEHARAVRRVKETASWTPELPGFTELRMILVGNVNDEEPPAKTATVAVLNSLQKC